MDNERHINRRGKVIRKPGKGKPEFICRPIQKLYPLEILRDKTVEERMDGEESEMCEEVQEQAQRPQRAAARDAQWKMRLMLDSYLVKEGLLDSC